MLRGIVTGLDTGNSIKESRQPKKTSLAGTYRSIANVMKNRLFLFEAWTGTVYFRAYHSNYNLQHSNVPRECSMGRLSVRRNVPTFVVNLKIRQLLLTSRFY